MEEITEEATHPYDDSVSQLQQDIAHEGIHSLAMRVNMYSTKQSLKVSDIIDRGNSTAHTLPRFVLQPSISLLLSRTVTELQQTVEAGARLIGRDSCFVVDPYTTCMNTLRGCNAVIKMNAAWIALRRRIELAERYILKYEKVYKGLEAASPTSTMSGLYSPLPRLTAAGEKLNYLFKNIPHHWEDFPFTPFSNITPGEKAIDLPVPPSPLLLSFPDREEESRPNIITYDESGTKIVRPAPLRSSYPEKGDFVLPEDNLYVLKGRKDKGKKKVSINPTEYMRPYEAFEQFASASTKFDRPTSPAETSYRVKVPLDPPPHLSSPLMGGGNSVQNKRGLLRH